MSEPVAIASESADELPPRPVEVFAGGGLALTAFRPQGRVDAGVVVRASDLFAIAVDAGIARFPHVDQPEGLHAGWERPARVSKDVSRVTSFGSAQFQFTPVQGSLWTRHGQAHRVELSYGLGFGAVHTVDDLEALQCQHDPSCEATKRQWHATTTYGAGLRLWLSDRSALRVDLASTRYIETIASYTLELKDTSALTLGLSVAFPGHRRAVRAVAVAELPFEEEPPEPPAEPRTERLPRDHAGPGAWFARADLGAAAWLGRYGPSPMGMIVKPAPAVTLGGGWESRGLAGRDTFGVELAFATAVHNGLNWKLQAQNIQAGGEPLGAWMQGDMHAVTGLAIGTFTREITPRVGLGVRVGGGVMSAPQLTGPLSDLGVNFPVHQFVHPELIVGPTIELKTAHPGLTVGLNSDFVFATGFDWGANVGAFAKYRPR